MKRFPRLLPLVLAVHAVLVLQAAGQDFSEVRLREGKEAHRARHPVEAIDQLRIAAFGFLDRPALLCETLVYLALSDEIAGRHPEALNVVERLSDVEGRLPACAEATIEQAVRAEFESRFRRRRSASVPSTPQAAPGKPIPSPESQISEAAPGKPAPSSESQISEASPGKPASSPESQISEASPPTTGQKEAESVGQDADTPARVKKSSPPFYPPTARRAKLGGTVILRVLVSETGLPSQVEVARHVRADLDAAAVTAVQRWTFEPARRNGLDIRAWTTIQVKFEP